MFDKYYQYIKSKEWFELKIDILNTRGCYCEKCKKKKYPAALQLHHLTYDRLFNEEPQDLMLVCKKCHMGEHGLLKKKSVKKKPKKAKHKYHYLNKRDRELQLRYDKRRG
jgi:5-methylcytosine-specific restriction endonuclease McrA